MLIISKPSYEAGLELVGRISAYLGGNWGSVYANNFDENQVCTNPTEFGVEWKDWMNTAELNGQPLLTPEEISAPMPDVLLYAKFRGTWNGGEWWDYVPPAPPQE